MTRTDLHAYAATLVPDLTGVAVRAATVRQRAVTVTDPRSGVRRRYTYPMAQWQLKGARPAKWLLVAEYGDERHAWLVPATVLTGRTACITLGRERTGRNRLDGYEL